MSGKTYTSSSRTLWGLVLLGTFAAVGLLAMASWGYRVVPVEMNEPALRFLACWLPLLLGAGLGLSVLALAWFGSSRSLRLTAEGLSHVHHGRATVIPWDLMVLVRPGRGRLGSALVSDGRHFVRIERALFPEFEEIMDALEERRKSRQGKKARL